MKYDDEICRNLQVHLGDYIAREKPSRRWDTPSIALLRQSPAKLVGVRNRWDAHLTSRLALFV